MSRFENYTGSSENYDLTRRPVAMESILGALACGARPLAEQVVRDAGCGTPAGRLVSLDEVLQGDTFSDPRGPLRREWRDGDSSWALVEEAELARATGEIERMLADDSMGPFMAERDERRRELGQATFVVGRRPPE